MYSLYLVTGATGFLGRTLVAKLIDEGHNVRALVLEGDPLTRYLPENTEIVYGDICDDQSLGAFFADTGRETCVIHCAGIVSVASNPGKNLYRVNVNGTVGVLRQCVTREIGKLIYVSSVHAIPIKSKGCTMTEDTIISPNTVKGDYAKSKAAATSLVFNASSHCLNANVVFPSGIIGPGDLGKGSITNMLLSFIKGGMHVAVRGGYDFVDVRDVADGIIMCSEKGQPGNGYILSGQYCTIRDILNVAKDLLGLKRHVLYLPLNVAEIMAPLYEKICLKRGKPLFFTPYSISVLRSNHVFSKRKAENELGYLTRTMRESIRDTIMWLRDFGKV